MASAAIENELFVTANTSLPPFVDGQIRYYLCLYVPYFSWVEKCGIPEIHGAWVKVHWWEETTGGIILIPQDLRRPISDKNIRTLVKYAVCCGPRQFSAYLNDMNTLSLEILSPLTGSVIGKVNVKHLSYLSPNSPISGVFPAVCQSGTKFGDLYVSISLESLNCYDTPTPDAGIANTSLKPFSNGVFDQHIENGNLSETNVLDQENDLLSFVLNKVKVLQRNLNLVEKREPLALKNNYVINNSRFNNFCSAASNVTNSAGCILLQRKASISSPAIENCMSQGGAESSYLSNSLLNSIFTDMSISNSHKDIAAMCSDLNVKSKSGSVILSQKTPNSRIASVSSRDLTVLPENCPAIHSDSFKKCNNFIEAKYLSKTVKFIKISIISLNMNTDVIHKGDFNVLLKQKTGTYIVVVKLPFSGIVTWDFKGHKTQTQDLIYVSRKTKNNVVIFSQDTVVPCELSLDELERMADKEILFTVRAKQDLLNFSPIGCCHLKLTEIVRSENLALKCTLPLTFDNYNKMAVDDIIQKPSLQVQIALVCSKKNSRIQNSRSLANLEVSHLCNKKNTRIKDTLSHSVPSSITGFVNFSDSVTSNSACGNKHKTQIFTSKVKYCLLQIIEGRNFSSYTQRERIQLICRFLSFKQFVYSNICSSSSQPHFYFTHVFQFDEPKILSQETINRMMVVEVWEIEPSGISELLGICKVPLQVFCTSYESNLSSKYSTQNALTAVDGFVPIVHPISGSYSGDLSILLVMGTWNQISSHLKSESLNYMHLASKGLSPLKAFNKCDSDKPKDFGIDKIRTDSMLWHHFEVSVQHVCGININSDLLSIYSKCSIQYYFPTEEHDEGGCLKTALFETDHVPLTSEINFSPRYNHYLVLPKTYHIENKLKTCILGEKGYEQKTDTLPIMLWCSTVSCQEKTLLAKATLPLALLCELIEKEQIENEIVAQCFTLPLLSVTDHSDASHSCGCLFMSIKYQHYFGPNISVNANCPDTELSKCICKKKIDTSCCSEKRNDSFYPSENHEAESHNNDGGSSSLRHIASFPLSSDNQRLKSNKISTKCKVSETPLTTEKASERSVMQSVSNSLLHVIVEQALHLTTNSRSENKKHVSTYITIHSSKETEVVLATSKLCQGCNPYWNWHVDLKISMAYEEIACLLFKVWNEDHEQKDSMVGYANVKLIPLMIGLKSISGWYNIVNASGNYCGQLKLSIIPHKPVCSGNSFKCTVQLPFDRDEHDESKCKLCLSAVQNKYFKDAGDGLTFCNGSTNCDFHDGILKADKSKTCFNLINEKMQNSNNSDVENLKMTLMQNLSDLDKLNEILSEKILIGRNEDKMYQPE